MNPKEIESTLLFEIRIRDERWEELKNIIEEGDVQPYTKYDPEFSIDYCKGFDAALVWVENQMKELEEK